MQVLDCILFDELKRPVDGYRLAMYVITIDASSMELVDPKLRPDDLKLLQQMNANGGCKYNGFWSIKGECFPC